MELSDKILVATYQGRKVDIIRGLRLPETGHQFRIRPQIGLPITPDFISAWDFIYESEASADEIFRRFFAISVDEALQLDIADRHEVALITHTKTAETV